MRKYAKVINENTKQCSIGAGTDNTYYQSLGMTEQEVEEAYDGVWYLKGYAPVKPVEELQTEVRAVRNQLLEATDKFMIADYPIDDETKEQYKAYRQYLRDYTQAEEWYKDNPLRFEEWREIQSAGYAAADDEISETVDDNTREELPVEPENKVQSDNEEEEL